MTEVKTGFVWLVANWSYESLPKRIDNSPCWESWCLLAAEGPLVLITQPYHCQYFRHHKMIRSLNVIMNGYIFVKDLSGWMRSSVLRQVYIISRFLYKWSKRKWTHTLGSPDFLPCSNEAFDAPRFNKEPFPNGSPVAVHTNEKSLSAWFAFPKCTSSSRPQRWFLFPRLGSHVYAFVPHYSASASTDPHLAFKFPDQPGSHAPDDTIAAPAEFFMQLLFRLDCRLDAF